MKNDRFEYKIGQVLQFNTFDNLNDFAIFEYLSDSVLYYGYLVPTIKEIITIAYGDLDLKMAFKDDIIYLLSKPENSIWSDSPFSISIYNKEKIQKYVDRLKKDPTFLRIVLLSRPNKVVYVIREFNLPKDFAHELNSVIIEQSKKKYTKEIYHSKIAKMYKTFPKSKNIAESDLIIAECKIPMNFKNTKTILPFLPKENFILNNIKDSLLKIRKDINLIDKILNTI